LDYPSEKVGFIDWAAIGAIIAPDCLFRRNSAIHRLFKACVVPLHFGVRGRKLGDGMNCLLGSSHCLKKFFALQNPLWRGQVTIGDPCPR